MSSAASMQILTYPDPCLKREAEPVTFFDASLGELVRALEETMRGGPGAVGIAAPQVGISRRVAIVDVSGRKRAESHGRLIMINPEITAWDGVAIGREGCLSVPDFTGKVIRAERVDLRASDERGAVYEHQIEGFEARAVQHEIDHLDGLLFLDRLVSRSRDLYRRKVYS